MMSRVSFPIKLGLPGKSGIGGIVAIPKIFVVATWSLN
jgi:glutaminase